jgi:hypothetical protein
MLTNPELRPMESNTHHALVLAAILGSILLLLIVVG